METKTSSGTPSDVPPWEHTEDPERVSDESPGLPAISPDEPAEAVPPEPNPPVSPGYPCPECGAPIPAADIFCSACGFSSQARREKELQAIYLQQELAAVAKDSAKASRVILILSILFAVLGTILGLVNKSQADDARRTIAEMSPDHTLQIEGEQYTVRQLRQKLRQENLIIFITNYFLAGVMAGLWFWSRKNLFPAIMTAFAVYLAVQVVNAIFQPSTLYQGFIFKIIFITLFISGIKTALKVRELQRALTD